MNQEYFSPFNQYLPNYFRTTLKELPLQDDECSEIEHQACSCAAGLAVLHPKNVLVYSRAQEKGVNIKRKITFQMHVKVKKSFFGC